MCRVRFFLTLHSRKAVERQLKTAQQRGPWRPVRDLLALLAVGDGQRCAEVALVLRVHEKAGAAGVRVCCGDGIQGAPRHQPTGRPPSLTPPPKAALATLIDEGSLQAGFSGACWRSPLIQQRIDDRFSVFSNVFVLAQLLKHRGFSAHEAAGGAAPLDEDTRPTWRPTTWPQMRRRAHERKALLLVGDEAWVPQGGHAHLHLGAPRPATDAQARRPAPRL